MTMSFMLYGPIFSFVFVRCYYISWRFFSVCVFYFHFVSFLWFFSLKALVSSFLVARFFIHGERFDAGRLCIWALLVNSLWILLYCCDSPVYEDVIRMKYVCDGNNKLKIWMNPNLSIVGSTNRNRFYKFRTKHSSASAKNTNLI